MSGPLPRVPSCVLAPMAWGYGRAIALRNRAYDLGRCQRVRLDLPVVSIGNLVVGGSGKTPVTAWIAGRLLDAGRRPLIAMRGYGPGDPRRSDEVLEYSRLLPRVPIAAGADRVAAIARARRDDDRAAATDIVLLDDGFQHRRLARSLDVVLVDAGRPCLEGAEAALLPRGWLREPPAGLARADAVVLTHADALDGATLDAIERLHGRPPLAKFRHAWRAIERHRSDGSTDSAPIESLRGLRVATLLGVAQPQRVRAMVEAAGAAVAVDIAVRDHQRYDAGLVSRIAAAARGLDAVLTTPKDWTKLSALAERIGADVLVPTLAVEPTEGAEALMARVMAAGVAG